LNRRHPEGVDRALLRSIFILARANARERVGLPMLAPAENVAAFDAALHRVSYEAPRRVLVKGDLVRRRGRRRLVNAKVEGRPLPASPVLHRQGGDRCKGCGTGLPWPFSVGVVYADNTAMCLGCHDAACEAQPRQIPTTTANCARCRKVRALDADGLCVTCTKEPPF
jgi:hypothetical protein